MPTMTQSDAQATVIFLSVTLIDRQAEPLHP